MKKNIQQDERVLAQKRKIASDAFNILWIGLLLSVLVQEYLFNAPLTQYAVEMVLFIAASIYIVVRNIIVGNNLFYSKIGGQASVIISSLVCGLTVTIINTILNYAKYSETVQSPIVIYPIMVAVITFICATVIALIPMELLYLANQKRQKDIESHLNEDE